MKKYFLRYEPIIVNDTEVSKWNVYYLDENNEVELKENYSCNGVVSSEIRQGYILDFDSAENLRVKKETETQTEKIIVEPIKEIEAMQQHENTNVVTPTMIGKKPVYKSKKWRLNILDYLKGLLIASLTSVLFILQKVAQQYIDGVSIEAPSVKIVLTAAISGGVGYLLKNLLTDNSKK